MAWPIVMTMPNTEDRKQCLLEVREQMTISELTFLGSVKKRSVLRRVSDFDDLCAREQLHYEAWRDDGRDAQLHEGSSIRRENDSDPVEGICRVGAHDAEEGDLAADEEDEERDRRP